MNDRRMRYVQKFYWIITNWGIFQGLIFWTRKQAVAQAKANAFDNGFEDWRDLYEIRKVTMTELATPRGGE
jgi:hypothetical protein